MVVETKSYGNIEVSQQQRISLTIGLFGFEQYKEFVLLDAPQKPFLVLQSIEDSQVAFILIEPSFFRDDYEPGIGALELEKIELQGKDDPQTLLLAVVTIPAENQGVITANLQGPIVINREKRMGMQCIAGDTRWMTKHNILEELSQKRTSPC